MGFCSNSSKQAVPQFELRVELWSCALEEELTLVNTPKKLAKKLRNSLGKTAGKKLCPLLDTPDPETFLQYNPLPSCVNKINYNRELVCIKYLNQ